MMTLAEIRERLEDRNLKVVAAKAGINKNTLYRLVNGASDPSYETVVKLVAYLNGTLEAKE